MKTPIRVGRLSVAVCAAGGLFFLGGGDLAADTLVAPASVWRYDDTGTDLGTAWRSAALDDSGWASGPAQLGYGDGDEATVLSFGPDANNKHRTYYFRLAFNLPDPAAYQAYTLKFVRDDGLLIYANGQEALRSNMPAGAISHGTFASTALGAPDESAWQESPLDPALLVPGDNVLAVEVHQSSATSSDLSFALELIGTPAPAPLPVVTLVSPPDLSTVTADVSFTVSATDAVGLFDATLYVGSAPRTVTFGAADSADAYFSADQPTTRFGSAPTLRVDGQSPHVHSVIKYPNMFGTGPGKVPAGSTIGAATLAVSVTNAGNIMKVYRLAEDWIEAEVTWNQRMAGVPWTSPGADGPSSNAGVALGGDSTATGLRTIDITPFVQEWSNGAPNYGIVLTDGGADGVEFSSREGATAPVLTVSYTTPWSPIETRPLAGTSATVTFTTILADQEQYAWNCLVTNTSGEQSWAPAAFRFTVDANTPDAPALGAPPGGATGQQLSPVLEVTVNDPNGDALDVTFYGRPSVAPEDFTIIPLPDTQFYSQSYPQIYTAQTQWIADNAIPRNIVFSTHLGDIVQTWDSTLEWQRADASMSILDGVIPYGLAPGNHDEPTTHYNLYFPFTRYENEPWYGGHYSTNNDNNFQLFSAGGVDFLAVHLDFCPAGDVIAWADSVLKAYPDRKAMITTHGYIDGSGNRAVHSCTSTQYIWDGLVVPNPNVYFVFCGHVSAEFARTDVVNGHQVHQLLSDYQGRINGGDGWLRILRFAPAENRVHVQTYSPWLGQYETDSNSQFTLDFPMREYSVIGTSAGVPSGSTASVSWPDLAANTEYEWYAKATDSSGRSRVSAVWTFRTGFGEVDPPVISGVSASNVTSSSATVVWSTDEPADSLVDYGLDTSYGSQAFAASLVTSHTILLTGLSGSTTYHYQVTSRDASGNTAFSADLTFTTLPPNAPPAAQDQSVAAVEDTPVAITLTASDADGDPLTYTVVTGPGSGALSGAAPNLTYTPSLDSNGPDSFTFRAGDGQAQSNVATVSITVTPVNDAPVASPQSVATDQNEPLAITLAATDVDGDPLTHAVVASPSSGTLSGTAPDLIYTPVPGYSGPDSFTFRASDGQADGNVALVSIAVVPAPLVDFRTQIVKVTIPGSANSATVAAPGAFAAVDPSRTITLISGVTQHAMGWTAQTTQNPVQISARVMLVDGSTLTARRSSSTTSQTDTVWVLLLEYIGLAGGPNEILVRDRRVHSWSSGGASASYGPIGSVASTSKVVVFNSGAENPNTGSGHYDRGAVRAYIDAQKTVQLRRGDGSGAIQSSQQVVEFTGANWHVQTGDAVPAPHVASGGPEAGGTNVAIANVGDVSRAWVYFTWQTNTSSLREYGHRVWLTSPTNLRIQEQAQATGSKTIRWHVIRNPQIRVQTGAADNQFNSSLTATVSGFIPVADPASSFAWVQGMTPGSGSTHPRDMWQFELETPGAIALQRGYSEATLYYRYFIVELSPSN